MNLEMPKTLPLLLTDPRQRAVEVVAEILRDPNPDPIRSLVKLSRYWKLKAVFSEPVRLMCMRHWVDNGDGSRSYITSKTSDTHIINGMIQSNCGVIGYTVRHGSHTGYRFDEVHKMISCEPVVVSKRRDEFETYEDFEKRFDLKFITKAEIQKLWTTPSAQTGQRYTRRDFKPISKAGQGVMKMFLQRFVGLDGPPATSGRNSFTRRDITISFEQDREFVYYSSEYPGCGNGSYGLVVNEHTWLHLEDD